MSEIEALIAKWRREMASHVSGGAELLDELEDHFRSEVETLVARGESPSRAVSLAATRLGTGAELGDEFSRAVVQPISWLPIRVLEAVAAFTAIVTLIGLIPKFAVGGSRTVMAWHMALVTLGYACYFVIGCAAVCVLLARLFRDLKPGQKAFVNRFALLWSALALALTASGMALGSLCPYEKNGWCFGFSTPEVGGIGILLWGSVMLAGYRRLRSASRLEHAMLLGVAGNVAVIAGWFGASIDSNHAVGPLSTYPVVAALILLQIVVACTATAPPEWFRIQFRRVKA